MTGDRDARFSAVFRRHLPAVRRYVLRRAWPDAVDDVVAETFLAAWRRLEELPEDPLPWLLATAHRCLANHRRGALRGAALIERLRAEPRPEPADEHRRAAQRESIARAFGRLSDAERELLMLTEWDGLSPARVARVLGVSSTSARARIYRARRKLRRALDEELGRSSVAAIARSAA
jgi:RNA polymerase sigma-70 factor, ECF subfamily